MTRRIIGILFSVLLISTQVASASLAYKFQPGKNWKKQKMGLTTGWVAKDKSKATIVVNTDTSKVGNYNIKKKYVPKIIRYLEEVKKIQGQSFNITKWKVNRHQFTKLRGNRGSILKLEGEYKGITGVRTRFIEWHYYIGKKFYQITYTQNSNRGKWSKKKAESVLKKFKPKGA